MSAKYGTPAFPIRGNIFYGNSGLTLILNLEWNNANVSFTGFALVCLILFTPVHHRLGESPSTIRRSRCTVHLNGSE